MEKHISLWIKRNFGENLIVYKMKQPRTEKFDIAYFQEYVQTYTERYPDQQNIMFLDMLYGIGISVDHKKYRGADGFARFLEWLGFENAKKNYEKAIKSLASEETAGMEWAKKLDFAFQTAAFGKFIDYKPEDHPKEEFDEGWLQNRNHGG